jgi:hypothetical protein
VLGLEISALKEGEDIIEPLGDRVEGNVAREDIVDPISDEVIVKGGKTGPNLYGVVGRDVGSVVDFKYSDAIRAKEGAWTFEQLDCFITKPKECVPGTKMPFPGLPDAAARADLLAFLRTLSGSPAPLPAP